MSNETIKKFNIVIKLRGDNVYDLYIDGKWVASRGGYDGILSELQTEIKNALINE